MRTFVLALACLSLGAAGAYQRKQKPPDVEVLETRARRNEGKIQLDGRVRTTGEKPIHGLIVIFDLISAENNVVGSERAVLDEDFVVPGQERSYHSETSEHARAVRYRIRAFALGDRELRAANTGPFPIE